MTHGVPGSVRYRYTALRADGSRVSGSVRARSEALVADSLLRDGVFPVRILKVPEWAPSRLRVSAADHAVALRTLAELLDAGLPPLRALQVLGDTAPPAWARALPGICSAVEQGTPLSVAIAECRLSLPPIVYGLLRAGEGGMGLAAAMHQAAKLMERGAAVRQALISSLTYPAVLLATGAASFGFLVMVVLPRFAELLHGLGVALPLSTRVVLASAELLRIVLPWLMAAIMAAGLAVRSWTRDPGNAIRWNAMLLRLPVLGPLALALASTNAARALASLLSCGVTLSDAMRYAARASGNPAVSYRVLCARDAVRHGEPLSAALLAARAVTHRIVRLARTGEETGRLAAMLEYGATLEQRDAERRIRDLVKLLEPILILAFGTAIAIVAAALLQAMYAVRPGT